MNLEGDDLRAAYYCVSEVMRDRQRHAGKSIPEWLHRHFHRLDREIRMSQLGQQFVRPTEQLKDEKLITAIEAAAILNMSKRQVNERLAAEFNALADRFAAACAVTDPERDPATMLDETDKVRKSVGASTDSQDGRAASSRNSRRNPRNSRRRSYSARR